jgi:hypothetical protein
MDINDECYHIKLVDMDIHPIETNHNINNNNSDFNYCQSDYKNICGKIPNKNIMVHLSKTGDIQLTKYKNKNNKILKKDYKWGRISNIIPT